ncbi:MAG: alcohol dehydrogenase catalytic domain-containing protein [Sporichthyaceae bacterium]
MRVLEVTAYGRPGVLRLAQRPDAEPIPGTVRVRMRATAVNPVDLLVRSGAMAARTPQLQFPFELGFDMAGTVLEDAETFTAGQRVVGLLPWFLLGGTAQEAGAERLCCHLRRPHASSRKPLTE